MPMKVTYYPGCALEGTANDYAASIAAVAALLDLQLTELDDWNCCGASAAHSLNHNLALDLAVRNLHLAQNAGLDLVAPCALCFSRLKFAEKALRQPDQHRWPWQWHGSIRIWDLADYLTQPHLLAAIAKKLVTPLTGLKAVCYYGCLTARPPQVTDKLHYENPQNLENLLKTLKAEPLDWSHKTDCCGAGLAVSRPDLIDTLVQRLLDRALAAGAECIVVSCQMCQANLDLPQPRLSRRLNRPYHLPILYFTELIALALGEPQVGRWLAQHLVDPRPLLAHKGFNF